MDMKHLHQTENPDSIEIGTPSKGGTVKAYGNFENIAAFKEKIAAAKTVIEFARAKLDPKPEVPHD